MSKLTSVEWIWQQIDDKMPFINLEMSQVFNGLLNAAKEMHKQEIVDAYKNGLKSPYHQDYTIITQNGQDETKSGQYYDETFN